VLAHAAKPLRRADREAFLNDVLVALQGHQERGPGLLHRIAREVQARYRDPALEAERQLRLTMVEIQRTVCITFYNFQL
jgi:hypothetical protein